MKRVLNADKAVALAHGLERLDLLLDVGRWAAIRIEYCFSRKYPFQSYILQLERDLEKAARDSVVCKAVVRDNNLGLLKKRGVFGAVALGLADVYAEVRDENRRSRRIDYRLG